MEGFDKFQQAVLSVELLKKHGDFISERKLESPETFETVHALITMRCALQDEPILSVVVDLCREQQEDDYAVIWLLGTAYLMIVEKEEEK